VFDESTFIARVESANTDEFADLLWHPSRLEERALRAYFGDGRYQRLHARALKCVARSDNGEPQGNVVVLHGMMGSGLATRTRTGEVVQLWVDVHQIMGGGLASLRLGNDGRSPADGASEVHATGIMKRHYGELLLTLSEHWNVKGFWYDWRKDMQLAAAELEARISSWFPDDAPVHIVAHAMGGQVARTFIKNYPARWSTMWDRETGGRRGGRLVLLGAPNHGSFVIPQAITGVESVVAKMALVDTAHSLREILGLLHSFPGLYQMLPSPLMDAENEAFYHAQTYGDLSVPQTHLTTAAEHHQAISPVVEPARMTCLVGTGVPTPTGLRTISAIDSRDGYTFGMEGDGRMSVPYGELRDDHGTPVPLFEVRASHGTLPVSDRVLSALPDILETGGATVLARQADAPPDARSGDACRALIDDAERQDEELLRTHVVRLRARNGDGRPAHTPSTRYLSYQERAVEELLTSGLLTFAADEGDSRADEQSPPFPPSQVEIAVVCGGIGDVPGCVPGPDTPDAIAVGHYIGVRPQAAEQALDQAITPALTAMEDGEEGILAQFSDRGVIHGDRGQVFFLPDPRTDPDADGRLIAVVGMGYAGRFGVPELTVAARELCWSLGRLGKQHLATVLIGAGNGNIPVGDAVSAWIRGIKHAVTGTGDEERRLRRVTFIEADPRRLMAIDDAIWAAKVRLEEQTRLHITYRPVRESFDRAELERIEALGLELARAEAERALWGRSARDGPLPTRVTLSLAGGTYTFAAMTENASLPERTIPLDPKLVGEANDELAAEWRPAMQEERGRLLETLLIPDDLKQHLAGPAPIVMVLDTLTARIHWEMVAQTTPQGDWPLDPGSTGDDLQKAFLGTSRGFTRQLATTFAPAYEPPPTPRRLLRVLVVADPAEDDRLPGAEEEGIDVADLFEAYNEVWGALSDNRVTVVRLLGATDATRTHVLRHLMLRSYDVLHYAGHCVFDENDLTRQGWVFTDGDLLSPNELNRIDRIPKFVFSNGCESGLTPDRSEERSSALAPGFAESFFHRGVANFVCTAWPVDDGAAREFAVTLYSRLLGLHPDPEHPGRYSPVEPKPMHEAMHDARLAIFGSVTGARTWGAYQHYGNPYFYLFDPRTMRRDRHPTER
jgi:pimeloyl-ACP methyl ester carboxylesterase